MTFKTGSITSATPAKVLFDLLDPDLVAVGYVRVETALASGGVTWNVYRSPAASNFFGQDWYFALGCDTSAQTTLYSCVFEDWDSTNKRAVRFAPSSTGLVPAAGYINPQAPSALPAGFTLSHLLPTTVFTYAYSTLIDRVAVGAWTSSTVSRFSWYIGLYDSFYSTTDDPFPLALLSIGVAPNYNAITTLVGSTTREPMTVVQNTHNFFVTPGVSTRNSTVGQMARLCGWNQDVVNLYQGSAPWVSRVILAGRNGSRSGGSPPAISHPRGLLRDLFTARVAQNGDRVTWTSSSQAFAGICLLGTVFVPSDQEAYFSVIPEY